MTTALVFPSQADADVLSASVDLALGYPKNGVNIGAGDHRVPAALSKTFQYSPSTRHPTATLFAYPEDANVRVATRTASVPASGWAQDLADSTWLNGSTKSPPSTLTSDNFRIRGHAAFVIPQNASPGPWVLYAPTLPGLPDELWMFQQFLAAGVAIAGIDAGESYGNEWGRELFSNLYAELVGNRGMRAKAALFCRSRGGVQAYNWAAENASKVACIAGIYPVGDLASFPGIETAAVAYERTVAQMTATLAANNPIDRLAPIAAERVPIMHLHGDSDVVVPLSANSQIIHDRYVALGGSMTLSVIVGEGHNLSPLFFQSQALADFVVAKAVAA